MDYLILISLTVVSILLIMALFVLVKTVFYYSYLQKRSLYLPFKTLFTQIIYSRAGTLNASVFEAIAIATHHQIPIANKEIEMHYLAGGDPVRVVTLFAKYKDQPDLTWLQLTAMDLSKVDIETSLKKKYGH